jgi:hypothetical protein
MRWGTEWTVFKHVQLRSITKCQCLGLCAQTINNVNCSSFAVLRSSKTTHLPTTINLTLTVVSRARGFLWGEITFPHRLIVKEEIHNNYADHCSPCYSVFLQKFCGYLLVSMRYSYMKLQCVPAILHSNLCSESAHAWFVVWVVMYLFLCSPISMLTRISVRP